MHAAGKRVAAVAAMVVLVASLAPARAQKLPGVSDAAMAALVRGEWPAYAGTYAAAKYSPLDQINASNVEDLEIAWRWTSPDHALRAAKSGIDPSVMHEATPLMIGGVLYTSTSLSQVAAIDAATGQTKWVYDPGVYAHGMPDRDLRRQGTRRPERRARPSRPGAHAVHEHLAAGHRP